MRLGPSNIRNWVNSLVLLVGSLSAHLIGGGGLISINNLLLDSLLIAILLVRTNITAISTHRLAILVVLVQSCGHFVLGGMKQTNAVMAFSHVICGFTSYQFIIHSEIMWERFASLASNFLLETFNYHVHLDEILKISQESLHKFISLKSEDSHLRRGPPLLIEKALA